MRGGTPRNPDRKTDGPLVGEYARLLGTPFLPWQQYVADVAGELDEDGSYFYDTIILSTPRQCGKSTLVDAKDTRNTQWGPNRFIYYLAQTGKDAGKHFKEYLKRLGPSPLSAIAARPYLGAGDLRQPFINGSTIMPMSITKVAGHGVQGDMITLDEAFSLSAETGKNIIDAFLPTTATRFMSTGVRPQVWITSTEGTAESEFFNQRIDECREGKQSRRTCWFDWGIPAGADPEDLETIMRHHPAAGLLWNIDQLKDFHDQFKNDPAGWARAFGNRRDEGISDRVIDERLWEATATRPVGPGELAGRQVTLGVAVDVDSTHTSISAAIANQDGTVTTQLLKVIDGTGAAPDEIRRLSETYEAPIAIDTKGTAADLSDRLRHLTDGWGSPVLPFCDLTAADYLTCGQAYVSGLNNHGILHASNTALDASAASSARTWSGDAWRVTRRRSTGLTSPLESCMLAAWGASHRPEDDIPVIV